MATVLEGTSEGSGRRIGIAVAEFNSDITRPLLEGCLATLTRHGVGDADVTVVWAPGAYELPLLCDQLARTGRYQALVALGAVIRGDTPHFDFVAGECARGVQQVMLERGVPVAFGVITTDNLEQARHRADLAVLKGSDQGAEERNEKLAPASNKGAEAAEVALRMASLLDQIT